MTQTEARQRLEAEIDRLERAPSLNGCSMTEDWQTQLDVFRLCKAALDGSAIDAKYDMAYQNGYSDGINSKLKYTDFLRQRCVALRNKCDELATKCHQLQQERDALPEKIERRCEDCKHYDVALEKEPCKGCFKISPHPNIDHVNWEWRGLSLADKTSDKEEKK